MATGGIEILASELTVLNASEAPLLPLKMKRTEGTSCGCNIAIWI